MVIDAIGSSDPRLLRSAEAREPTRLRKLLRGVGWLALAHAIVGVLLRITVRDTFPGVAVAYYLTPPMLLALSAAITLVFACRFRRWLRGALIVGALATITGSACSSFALRTTPMSAERRVRLAFWNVGRWEPRASMADEILAYDPDVIVLVEARSTENGPQWPDLFRGYEASSNTWQMLALARGRLQERSATKRPRSIRARAFRVATESGSLDLMVTDVNSAPARSRREPLAWLAGIADTSEANVIVGDFNTPSDSVHFQPLRESWDQAFDVSGSGYRPTWPMPFPVLDLDQAWVRRGSGVRATAVTAGWSRRADHRPLIVDLTLERAP
ncbi:MAG: endonuclease/exonuclease/phosphatase family protein [Planctomycetota bacterium]